MKTIPELLDAVKAAKGIESDYALAKVLNLKKQQISTYYKRKVIPSEYACLEIAKALNISYEEVSAIVQIDAEKDEERRNAWRDYYKSIGGIAASIALLFFLAVNFIVTPTPANASEYEISKPNSLYYVKSEVKGVRTMATETAHKIAPQIACNEAHILDVSNEADIAE